MKGGGGGEILKLEMEIRIHKVYSKEFIWTISSYSVYLLQKLLNNTEIETRTKWS